MSNAPLPELRHHHDVDAPQVDAHAFRQGWRIRTRLDALLADRRITPAEWQAAVEYRDLAATARGIRTLGLLGRLHTASDREAGVIARLDAETRVRASERRIGRLATALIVACVVEDLSWREIARRIGRTHETARNWTTLAVRALGAVWTDVRC